MVRLPMHKVVAVYALAAMALGVMAAAAGCTATNQGSGEWEISLGYQLRIAHRGPQDGTEGKVSLEFAEPSEAPDEDDEKPDANE